MSTSTRKAVAETNLTNDEKYILEAMVRTLNVIADENEAHGVSQTIHPLLVRSWKYAGCEMRSYMNRLRKWMQTSTETFVMACALMRRLDEQGFLPAFTQTSIHLIFLACLVVMIKLHEDVTLSNTGFAKIGGVNVQDLCAMEKYVVRSLKWTLVISEEEYVCMLDDLLVVSETLDAVISMNALSTFVPLSFASVMNVIRSSSYFVPLPTIVDAMELDEAQQAKTPSYENKNSMQGQDDFSSSGQCYQAVTRSRVLDQSHVDRADKPSRCLKRRISDHPKNGTLSQKPRIDACSGSSFEAEVTNVTKMDTSVSLVPFPAVVPVSSLFDNDSGISRQDSC